MLFMGKACLPMLFSEKSPKMHREIVDHLMDNKYDLLNVIAPRGHAKTTLTAQVYPLWHIFCEDLHNGKPPKPKFVLLTSKSRQSAVNTLTTIKNILEHNRHFHAIFGYHGSQNAQTWREDIIHLENGSVIVCKGWEQQIRGLNIDGMRPSLIVGDDIESEENTKTQDAVDKTFRRFVQAIMPALGKGGRVINVGTPLVQNSLVFTLGEMEEWTTLHYKAIYTEEGIQKALWPEIWPLDKLLKRKRSLDEIGRISSFYREFMCEVIGDEDQLFNHSYLRYWEGELKTDENKKSYLVINGRNVPVNIFMGVDPASTLSRRSDYTCIFILAMDAGRNVYCIDYLRKRLKPIDVANQIIGYYRKYYPMKSQIETVGYQSMISDYIRRDRGMYIPGLDIKNNPRQGKTERLEGLQPMFARGNVYLRKTHKETNNMEDFQDELLIFPRGKHDDTIDAFFYAIKGAFPPYHDVILSDTKSNRNLQNKRTYDWMIE
jgi:predicted phage terminase large subunit-like protein